MRPDWHLTSSWGVNGVTKDSPGKAEPLNLLKAHTLAYTSGSSYSFLAPSSFPPLYQKEKEQETKEEESEGRQWVKIASLLWLPSCTFQVLWPPPSLIPCPGPHTPESFFFQGQRTQAHFPHPEFKEKIKVSLQVAGCWRAINYTEQRVTWSQEQFSSEWV